MDMHLEFIVDQTAKYSNWLVKGLTTASSTATPSEPSLHSAAASIDGQLMQNSGVHVCNETVELPVLYGVWVFV